MKMSLSFLQLKELKKRFDRADADVIHGVDLTAEQGEFVVFVGPSGCGKSTLLRMIAGLESVTSGSITMDGCDVTNAPPSARHVAMVFQSYALYPHMTVAENLSFGMRMRGVNKNIIAEKIEQAVEILQLRPYLNRKPGALSGGQCQRVAIGRALVQEPQIFLFDEPLSNLDSELRLSMRLELGALHKRLGKTTIYVTHDQTEAMTLADRIVVLRDGKIEQIGAPLTLYQNPDNQFVAGFIGSPAMNFLDANLTSEGAVLRDGTVLHCDFADEVTKTGDCKLGVRPEHFVISEAGALTATVKVVERLGAATFVYAERENQTLCIQVPNDFVVTAGAKLRFQPHLEWLYVFDADQRTISRSKLPRSHQ
jgi:ABC-type sugar transport system ATPase subunit